MRNIKSRQYIAFILSLFMMLSFHGSFVLAAEESDISQEVLVNAEIIPEESYELECEKEKTHTVLQEFQNEIDGILVKYNISNEIVKEELISIVEKEDFDYREALYEIFLLEENIEEAIEVDKITEVEATSLIEKNQIFCEFAQILEEQAASDNSVSVLKTVTVMDDRISIADTQNDISVSNNKVTAKASGGLFSQKTNTITITNASGKAATISFTFSASNYSSFSEESASGSFSIDMKAGDTYTLSIKGKAGITNTTATLTLSDFGLTEAAASSKVTFKYNSTLGSITVDGATIESGSNVDVSSSGKILVASTASDVSFLGWINEENHQLLSDSATYTLEPVRDMTVVAAFAKANSAAWFLVDGSKWTNDLSEAVTLGSKVVLMHDGLLPTGSYEIPTGVTLLVPYDDANTLCKAEPTIHENIYTSPTVYRTLTMASGAKITVEGAISVSGSQSSKYDCNGQPSGPLGFIKMSSGSNITINNGANLYVWGYITGAGTVTAKTGATVYECFQVMDYRGGDVTSKMQNNKYNVFPMSQYYIQNIEVPLTMEYGVIEYGHFAVQVTGAGKQKALVPFVGDNGMFNITSGTVTKDYDENTDRLIIDINGDVSCNPYEFSIKVALIGNVTLKTENYVLPLNQNITMNAYSGTMTVSQDLALLPETEINIAEKATCKLINDARIIAYDLDDWGGYCDTGNVTFVALRYAPGRINNRTSLNKDATVLINGFLDASEGYVYTTKNGANIYSDGTGSVKVRKGTETVTYQVTTNDTTISGYPEISITSAQLKNKDNTFTLTSKSTAEANTYTYENGRWTCKTHIDVDPADYTCDVCGKRLAVELVGRTLKYVDKINVICLFEFLDQSMLVDENSDGIIDNAGMVVWDSKESVRYNEDGSPKGYSQLKVQLKHYPDNPGYYYAETDGITTPNLHKSAYYAGYVKVEDQYYYSDVFEYGPSIYAYNMLEKETGENANQTTPGTKNLCVTLLNYISAAQQYFPCADDDANTVVPSESELVNIALDEITTGKDINADGALEDLTKFGVYDLTAPEKDSSAEANGSIFKRVGKNLYFTDTVNLAAMFEFAEGTSWSDSGTIFWTESQWTAMGENPTPDIENYGSGKLESPLNSYNNSSTIYYAMCPISIAPKDMADTKIYSMGYVEVNNVYQYSNVKAYGIEDYIANIVEDNKNAENGTQGFYMKLLAQQLYHYERAARAALLNQ